jgi:hypothetical protein
VVLALSAFETRISVPHTLMHALDAHSRRDTNVLSPLSIPATMCGIFCSISRNDFISPDTTTKELLQNRGPDSTGQHEVVLHATEPERTGVSSSLHATFLSTVLSLRGKSMVEQPLHDIETASILCWNGEAWSIGDASITGNDSQHVFDKLLEASCDRDSVETAMKAVVDLLASIRGPYAFVYYDAPNKLMFYGRDCLGRRSLLLKSTLDDSLILSSVCDNASGESWTEVEADGIYIVDLNSCRSGGISSSMTRIPHHSLSPAEQQQQQQQQLSFVGKSLASCALLITLDYAISKAEPRHPRGLVF